MNMPQNRKTEFYNHFQKLAPHYARYKKRFSYYWNDIISNINFFLTEDSSILDVGCGIGDTLAGLKGSYKLGIDICPNMIEQAQQKYPQIEFKTMDASRLELNKKFDVVILSNTIGYLEDIQDILVSLKQVCKPNTRLIITNYNQFWEPVLRFGELTGIKKKSPKQNWLTIGDIRNLLNLSGFEVYRAGKRILFPCGIPVISYLLNKILGRLPFFNHFGLNTFVFARLSCSVAYKHDEFSVSVIIPARNESGNIENAILRMPEFSKHLEIIFVEGNSTDNTWETIQQVQHKYAANYDIKIVRQDGKGKGDAVRKGFSIASGDVLMILDADLTVPPEDLPKFYNALIERKGEFINGSRLVYPMESKAMRHLNIFGNKFFSAAFSWILEQPIKDTLCGTKVMFRADYMKLAQNRKFFGEFDPFGDFDLIFGAYKLNLKIIDLPVVYRERTYGDTNISRFTHGMILLRMTLFAIAKIKFW
jgi:ubiquinone/menaquinone biosynthesis C-methylase UbiE